jgi:hypothetical protein
LQLCCLPLEMVLPAAVQLLYCRDQQDPRETQPATDGVLKNINAKKQYGLCLIGWYQRKHSELPVPRVTSITRLQHHLLCMPWSMQTAHSVTQARVFRL